MDPPLADDAAEAPTFPTKSPEMEPTRESSRFSSPLTNDEGVGFILGAESLRRVSRPRAPRALWNRKTEMVRYVSTLGDAKLGDTWGYERIHIGIKCQRHNLLSSTFKGPYSFVTLIYYAADFWFISRFERLNLGMITLLKDVPICLNLPCGFHTCEEAVFAKLYENLV